LNNYLRLPWTSQSGSNGKANPTARNGSSPKYQHTASLANASSRSFLNSPRLWAAFPKECLCEERTEFLANKFDQGCGGGHPLSSVLWVAKEE
jgi:hypothetical protein